jgi:hypothetical protein
MGPRLNEEVRMKMITAALWAIIFTAALCGTGLAETRQVSWAPVTTYGDGTPIEAEKSVGYTVYWSIDPGLSVGTLRELVSNQSGMSATFDPENSGMARGQTVYFTAKSVLSTGEESLLSAALQWVVPLRVPEEPSNLGVTNGGIWRISWDAVSAYTDGSPLEAGRTVRYTVCWTADPWLAAETLKPILSSVTETSAAFDPVAAGMAVYQTVYFTVKAVLDTGAESSLSMGFPWNVPNSQPAAPWGMAIAKVSAAGQPYSGQLSWNPVTTYTNGSPIEAGKSASYTVYWTTDPGLAAGTLRLLASSVQGTSTVFSPSAQGMIPNQRVYFTAKTVLSSGEESPLSTGLSWRVSNKGPGSPSNGKIVKK